MAEPILFRDQAINHWTARYRKLLSKSELHRDLAKVFVKWLERVHPENTAFLAIARDVYVAYLDRGFGVRKFPDDEGGDEV